MSREDVSARTRIPLSVLQALENGQAERLPERVFVLNYVRSYAQVIGLSPEEAILRYEELGNAPEVEPSPKELERQRRKRAWTVVAGLAGALLALAVVLWALQQGG